LPISHHGQRWNPTPHCRLLRPASSCACLHRRVHPPLCPAIPTQYQKSSEGGGRLLCFCCCCCDSRKYVSRQPTVRFQKRNPKYNEIAPTASKRSRDNAIRVPNPTVNAVRAWRREQNRNQMKLIQTWPQRPGSPCIQPWPRPKKVDIPPCIGQCRLLVLVGSDRL
jgi:hypothetical protein